MKSDSTKETNKQYTKRVDKRVKKKQGNKAKERREYEEWKKIPPKQGEPKHKMCNNKVYYYCDEHQAWGRHKEEDCKEKKKRLSNELKPNHQDTTKVTNSAINSQDDFITTLENIMTDE